MDDQSYRLLDVDEPAPVTVTRHAGSSPFVLTCDHAGHAIPRRLGTLGLDAVERKRHIAWDIGALAVAERLSAQLDAPLVAQAYSRLVIDCNRAVDRPDAMAPISERTLVPGNQDITPREAAARIREIHAPYHEAIAALLDDRQARREEVILICVHSFTPVYKDAERPWHIGLLYNRERRLADALHPILADETDLCVGDNEPYAISDESDYSVPVHGEQRGLVHIEIEIRNDMIGAPDGQDHWAARLRAWLQAARTRLG